MPLYFLLFTLRSFLAHCHSPGQTKAIKAGAQSYNDMDLQSAHTLVKPFISFFPSVFTYLFFSSLL